MWTRSQHHSHCGMATWLPTATAPLTFCSMQRHTSKQLTLPHTSAKIRDSSSAAAGAPPLSSSDSITAPSCKPPLCACCPQPRCRFRSPLLSYNKMNRMHAPLGCAMLTLCSLAMKQHAASCILLFARCEEAVVAVILLTIIIHLVVTAVIAGLAAAGC